MAGAGLWPAIRFGMKSFTSIFLLSACAEVKKEERFFYVAGLPPDRGEGISPEPRVRT